MSSPLLEKHHRELARATASAMQRHFQETVDICSELLTSGVYEEMEAAGEKDASRRARAETRITLATAMHYTEAHHDDVLKVLNHALDAPIEVQKDVYFTIAVVQLSAERPQDARVAMEKCLTLTSELKKSGHKDESGAVEEQEREALEFLSHLGAAGAGPVN
jgi:hypothetical protein